MTDRSHLIIQIMDQLLIEFGNAVNQLLTSKGWNQQSLATELSKITGKKIGRQYVNQVIQGKSNLTIRTIHNIMSAFGMEINFIITEKNNQL